MRRGSWDQTGFPWLTVVGVIADTKEDQFNFRIERPALVPAVFAARHDNADQDRRPRERRSRRDCRRRSRSRARDRFESAADGHAPPVGSGGRRDRPRSIQCRARRLAGAHRRRCLPPAGSTESSPTRSAAGAASSGCGSRSGRSPDRHPRPRAQARCVARVFRRDRRAAGGTRTRASALVDALRRPARRSVDVRGRRDSRRDRQSAGVLSAGAKGQRRRPGYRATRLDIADCGVRTADWKSATLNPQSTLRTPQCEGNIDSLLPPRRFHYAWVIASITSEVFVSWCLRGDCNLEDLSGLRVFVAV